MHHLHRSWLNVSKSKDPIPYFLFGKSVISLEKSLLLFKTPIYLQK